MREQYLQDHKHNRNIDTSLRIAVEYFILNPQRTNEQTYHQQILKAEQTLV